MASSLMSVAQKGAAAVLVLALLLSLIWALRRYGFARFSLSRPLRPGRRRLSVVERLPLTPQHSLHLVQVADQILLVGSSPYGITLLDGAERQVASTRLMTAELQAKQER